jgi:hypothetical protein
VSATFFVELKRRNVYKVTIAALIAWLLLQAASYFFPTFEGAGLDDDGVRSHHCRRVPNFARHRPGLRDDARRDEAD